MYFRKEEERYTTFVDKLIEEHENDPDVMDFKTFIKELKITDEDLKSDLNHSNNE